MSESSCCIPLPVARVAARSRSGGLRALHASADDRRQDDCVVMRFIARPVHEGDAAAQCQRRDLAHEVLPRPQLSLVTATKLAPSLRLMPEPSPQLRRRGDVLQPFVDRSLLLAQPARPEAINENAIAVLTDGGLVRPLQPEHVTSFRGSVSPLRRCGSSTIIQRIALTSCPFVRRVAERVSTATWPQWRIYDRAQGLSVVWLSWSMVQTLHSHAGENVATAPLALRAVATPSESRAMAGPIRTHEWRPNAGPRTDLDAISPTLRSISRPRPSHSVLTLHGRAMWKLVMHVVRERLQRRTLFALPGRRDQQASRRLCRTPASER